MFSFIQIMLSTDKVSKLLSLTIIGEDVALFALVDDVAPLGHGLRPALL